MIYTITFNPALDYIITVEHFQTGRVNRTAAEHMYPGGKGINVSIVLQHLGMDSRVLGFVAGFTGDEIEKRLREQGCHTDFIHIPEGMSRINMKLRSDEETEINGMGPTLTPELTEELLRKLDGLTAGDVLVLAGSIPQTVSDRIYQEIMERLTGKDVLIAVDATKDLLRNVLPLHPFLVKPNNHELSEMLGVEINSKEDVIRHAEELQKMGGRNILVSMAGDGAVLLTETGEVYTSEAHKGTVVNSVGAGDSMVAGFINGYLRSGSYRTAFEFGLCAGSASAFSEQLATKAQVEALLMLQENMTKRVR